MLKEQKNSKKKGDVGLGAAIAFFTKEGYCVSIPLTDSQDYDLVVEMGGKLNRIQIKTTTFKSKYGIYQAQLRVLGGNQSFHTIKKFDPNRVEYLFVLTDEGHQYLIPSYAIDNTTTINLGDKYKDYLVPKATVGW